MGVYKTIDTISPESTGTVIAEVSPVYVAERGSNSTLNFIIPAEEMAGNLRLKVRITNGPLSDRTLVYLDVTLRQTLRVAGILFSYNGPDGKPVAAGAAPVNINLARPDLADLQATSAWTLTIYPVQPAATYRFGGTKSVTTPLNDPVPPTKPGECSPNWTNLIDVTLVKARTDDKNRPDFIYYGLLPAGTPIGTVIGTNSGCGGAGLGAGVNGDQRTMAHEIGHGLGLNHAPCGTQGALVDSNYPIYEPYDNSIPPPPGATPNNASIGEYGLDINNGNVYNPTTFKDFMSYCGPGWISPYHHRRLFDNPGLERAIVSGVGKLSDDPVMADPYIIHHRYIPVPPRGEFSKGVEPNFEPLISIIGIVQSEKEVEVKSVARLEACRYLPNAEVTDFVAELVDQDNKLLASAPLQHLPSYGHGECSCSKKNEVKRPPYFFQTFLTDIAPGATLRIRKDDEQIWVRHAPATPPKIQQFKARVSQSNLLSVKWSARSETEQDPEAWMQWSADKGNSWNGLTVGLMDKSAEIDISSMPSGPILLRLLVHDGFYTTTSKPVPVRIPSAAPKCSILNPLDGTTILAGRRFRLWGAVTGMPDTSADSESVRWLIDGKEIARGLDIYVTAPPEGQHHCI